MIRKYNTIQPSKDRTPNSIKRWFVNPGEYEGATSMLAYPGEYLARVHRDAEVNCKCIWTSEVYFDDENRPRQDAAFGLCVGPIDGVIRIEAGEDRIPIYNYLGLDDVVTGNAFYKSLEVLTGEFDQSQSSVIKKHLGDDDTPYYPGLAYFVLKGFKLWKWNNQVPFLQAVVLRNIADIDNDEYADEPTFYNPPSGWPVTSITGDPDDMSHMYVTASGINVYKVDLSTNTWTSIANSASVGATNNKQFNVLKWYKGSLYLNNYAGLWKWNGVANDWTNIVTSPTSVNYELAYNEKQNILAWYVAQPLTSPQYEVYTYDGTTVSPTTFIGASDGYKVFGSLVIGDNGEMYMEMHKSANDTRIFKYRAEFLTWGIGTDTTSNTTVSKGIHIKDDKCVITQYGIAPSYLLMIFTHTWVLHPAAPGVSDIYPIKSDTAYRVSDLEYFSNRWHVTRNVFGGTQELYRLESDLTTVTTMPAPAGASAYQTLIVQKVGNRLFVGTTRGFWEAADD